MEDGCMSYVFVVEGGERPRRPCAPVHPGRARFLLRRRHAAVLRRSPFTLVLKSPPDSPRPAGRSWMPEMSGAREARDALGQHPATSPGSVVPAGVADAPAHLRLKID